MLVVLFYIKYTRKGITLIFWSATSKSATCTLLQLKDPILHVKLLWRFFLAYQIRKSEVFALDRNSYLTHVILPMGRIKKKKVHMNLVCTGCIGCHVTLLLGWCHCNVIMTSNFKMSNVNVIMYGREWYFKNKRLEIERYARKNIKHECSVWTENLIPWDHCFASFGIASWCQTVTLGTESSIRTSRSCKILIVSLKCWRRQWTFQHKYSCDEGDNELFNTNILVMKETMNFSTQIFLWWRRQWTFQHKYSCDEGDNELFNTNILVMKETMNFSTQIFFHETDQSNSYKAVLTQFFSPKAYRPPPSAKAEPGLLSFGKYAAIRFNASFSWPCQQIIYQSKFVSSQCAHGKSSIVRKPEVHPELFKW